jgi:DNA-binding MarR family transcriptional regulator
MNDRLVKVGDSLLRIFNKFLENQRQPRYYGVEEPLYPAEVHLVMLIGHTPNASITELAEAGGVTKGAVSQMVKRLENKGLITRKQGTEDAKRVALELTSKGKIAFYSHERIHEEADAELLNFLKSLGPKQLQTVERFLNLLEKGIDKRNAT